MKRKFASLLILTLLFGGCSSSQVVRQSEVSTIESGKPDQSQHNKVIDRNEPDIESEPFNSPFVECNGQRRHREERPEYVADPTTISKLRERIYSKLFKSEHYDIFAIAGPNNVFGGVEVGLRKRNQNTVNAIIDIATQPGFSTDMVCLDLPPIGYYDRVIGAEWAISPQTTPVSEHWQNLELFIQELAPGCGVGLSRIRKPTITYTDTEVIIEILLYPISYGVNTLACFQPDCYLVSLSENPGDRRIVSGAKSRKVQFDKLLNWQYLLRSRSNMPCAQ